MVNISISLHPANDIIALKFSSWYFLLESNLLLGRYPSQRDHLLTLIISFHLKRPQGSCIDWSLSLTLSLQFIESFPEAKFSIKTSNSVCTLVISSAGRAGYLWPGLNTAVYKDGSVQRPSQRGEAEQKEVTAALERQRDEWDKRRKTKIKRERGWTGNSWGGISLGPPDPGPNGGVCVYNCRY